VASFITGIVIERPTWTSQDIADCIEEKLRALLQSEARAETGEKANAVHEKGGGT
jgi:hypothetical protein